MRFLREILNVLGGGEPSRVQYTVVDGKGGYFQNVKKILSFSEHAVVFAGAKGAVRVEGNRLSLGKYGAGDAAVLGDVVRVSREEGDAN